MNSPKLAALYLSRSYFARAAALAGAVWLLGTLGGLDLLDGVVYDTFYRWENDGCSDPVHVLLVELPSSALDDETLVLRLIEELRRRGARQSVVAFQPPVSWREIRDEALLRSDVVVPIHVEPDPLDPDSLMFAERFDAVKEPLRRGVLRRPPGAAGSCRSHYSRLLVEERTLPSLEAAAFAGVEGRLPDHLPDVYLVRFRGPAGSIPVVSLARVLSGDVLPELVAGKSVLIGREASFEDAGLITPTTERHDGMSLLEYHGHALDTLLGSRSLRVARRWEQLLVLVSVTLFGAFVYRYSTVHVSTLASLALVAAYTVGESLTLRHCGVWFPFSEVLACQAGAFVLGLRRRAIELTTVMQHLVSDATSQLRDRYWPGQQYSTAPTWELLAEMINQTLDLRRLIFLEAVPGRVRLREIAALHCNLNEIAERRRDYTRAPYSTALQARGPVRVEQFLESPDSIDERQYLVPLTFCGELLGFCALGVEPAKEAATSHFDDLLRDYTSRISELLYTARRTGKGEGEDEGVTRRLAVERTSTTYHMLASALGLMGDRLATLESLLNRVDSGVVVYDIFGRILQINEVALDLLKREGISPFEMSALDMVLALSDFDQSRARRTLRRVVVDSAATSFPSALRTQSDSRYFVHLKPLVEGGANREGEIAHNGGARTVLLEIVDMTTSALVYEMKGDLMKRLGLELRSYLSSIGASCSLLAGKRLLENQQRVLLQIMDAKVRQSVELLTECKQYLALDADVDDFERFPVESGAALLQAVHQMRAVAEQKGVEIALVEPSFLSSVFASTKKLQELFRAILAVLVQDAGERSTVLVRVLEDEDVVAFGFSNSGFGIPDELLQEYLFGDQTSASEEFQSIREAVQWIESWGGEFEAASGVGVGMQFKLHLVKFI